MGTITCMERAGDLLLEIAPDEAAFPLSLGASIACHGICLTVTEARGQRPEASKDSSLASGLWPLASSFTVALSAETLACTNAATWQVGTRINLEPSLAAGDPLGGHFVSGHVDGLATAIAKSISGDSVVWEFTAPAALMPFIARKASVTLDRVSLTVNQAKEEARGQRPEASKDSSLTSFTVNIIAHTAQHTSFGALAVGDRLNLEVDLLARYVGRMMETRQ